MIPVVVIAGLAAVLAAGGGPPVSLGGESQGTARSRTVAMPLRQSRFKGVASWYATGPQGPGHAAADKRLQRWLGKGWRGEAVNVCNLSQSVCVRVIVDDTCGCPGRRLIDLHPEDFAILDAVTAGLTDVVVTR